jgi:hypothetical protein
LTHRDSVRWHWLLLGKKQAAYAGFKKSLPRIPPNRPRWS